MSIDEKMLLLKGNIEHPHPQCISKWKDADGEFVFCSFDLYDIWRNKATEDSLKKLKRIESAELVKSNCDELDFFPGEHTPH